MSVFLISFRNLVYFFMSSSAFLETERKKLKMEWEKLPNPKPSWEEYKLIKFKKTFK